MKNIFISTNNDSFMDFPELYAKQPDEISTIHSINYFNKSNCDPHCASLSNYATPINKPKYFQRKSFHQNNGLRTPARKQFNSFTKHNKSVLENKLKSSKLSSRIKV